MDSKNKKTLTIVVVILVLIVAYVLMATPDKRTVTERVGDAVSELPDVDRARDQLHDRSPAEKLGDAAREAGEDVKRTVNEE
jgi:hypothetical protein